MLEYFIIFFYLLISLLISGVLLFLSYLLVYQNPDFEKLSAYECGFQPFEEARTKFDIRYYLLAILFLVFDLEIMFMFPWCIAISKIGFFGFWVLSIFLFILTLGFFYEWFKGALEWD